MNVIGCAETGKDLMAAFEMMARLDKIVLRAIEEGELQFAARDFKRILQFVRDCAGVNGLPLKFAARRVGLHPTRAVLPLPFGECQALVRAPAPALPLSALEQFFLDSIRLRRARKGLPPTIRARLRRWRFGWTTARGAVRNRDSLLPHPPVRVN